MGVSIIQMIFAITFLFGIVCIFLSIGIIYYIGKTRIKEIDKAVIGYELPNDSIFTLGLRAPNYAFGFMWKWFARRTKLAGKIEHFDKQFQRPFLLVGWLSCIGGFFLVISSIIQEFYL